MENWALCVLTQRGDMLVKGCGSAPADDLSAGVSYAITEQFLTGCRLCKTMAELERLMIAVCLELGFDYFALLHHIDLRKLWPATVYLTNYPPEWTERFIQNRFYLHDPVFEASLHELVAFLWADIGKRFKINARQRAIFDGGRRAGLGEGMTVPARMPGEHSGSCSFATRRGRSLPSPAHLALVELIGLHAFAAARRIAFATMPPQPPVKLLTKRQRDCLRLAAKGLGDKQIAWELAISPETVTQHISMAARRYGVRKRLPLAVRALHDSQLSYIDLMS